MSEIEFFGGLYLDDGRPVLPADNIEASILKAAGKRQKKTACRAAMRVVNNLVMEYDGPKDPEELFKDDRFVFVTMVGIEKRRTLRTRPFFEEWSGSVDVLYNPELLDENLIISLVEYAGAYYGLCDWRPKYGRFKVVSHETI